MMINLLWQMPHAFAVRACVDFAQESDGIQTDKRFQSMLWNTE